MLIDANHIQLTLSNQSILKDVSLHLQAGEIYGLELLARHVEDHDQNTTRFLVMAREPDLSRRGFQRPLIAAAQEQIRPRPGKPAGA